MQRHVRATTTVGCTAGLLKRQQSEERELSLNNESFKFNEVNWLLGMPPGYAHDKKKFRNP